MIVDESAVLVEQGAVIVCLGCQCWVSTMARSLGLLTESGPFDWVAVSPMMVQHMLQTDFHDFVNPLNLVYTGKKATQAHHKVYSPMLVRYGFEFGNIQMFQHFPSDRDLHGAIMRRVDRFRAHMDSGAPIIFVTGLAVDNPQDASRMGHIFNEEAWRLFSWLQNVRENFHMVAIFCECHAHQYGCGTSEAGANSRYVFVNMGIPGRLRGAHFEGQDAAFVRHIFQSIIRPAPYPPAPQIPSRYPTQDGRGTSLPTAQDGRAYPDPTPTSRNMVLVLIDSYYKVHSNKGTLLKRLRQQHLPQYDLDVVPLPGALLSGMSEVLRARAERLQGYAGVLVVSMGNDLVNDRWDNISQRLFVEQRPALNEVIADMASLLHPVHHHTVIYGGSGRLWWCSDPSQTLGDTFDTRRDWVVNAFRSQGIHTDTGEVELMQLGYTVNDVDRFHHKTSGSEKALFALLQWIAEACR